MRGVLGFGYGKPLLAPAFGVLCVGSWGIGSSFRQADGVLRVPRNA